MRTQPISTLSTLLSIVLFFFFCSPSNSPFSSANATISLLLVNSKGLRSETNISDTVGDTVQIGVSAYLFHYVTSVSLVIGKTPTDTDTSYTFGAFSSTTDTFWLKMAFKSGGSRTVTATAVILGAPKYSTTATVVIIDKPTFTVTYIGNGYTSGNVPRDSNTYQQGTRITILANTGNLARLGYSFEGWNTKSDGSGTLYYAGSFLTMGTANDTLFVKWKLNNPAISKDVDSMSILEGETATFTITAVGDSLEYQWQKNDINISGATSVSYATPAALPSDSGAAFRCIVSNSAGKDTSASAILSVLRTYIAITAGDGSSMTIERNGALWVTGSNFSGQLGDGGTTERNSFFQTMSGVVSVATGQNSTMILKKDGTLWGTGANNVGQLANNSTSDLHTPMQVMSGVSAVTSGQSHTIILKSDGTLRAVGTNNFGQLCDGSTTDKPTTELLPFIGVSAISAGLQHTMVLLNNGSLWAAGANYYGQLGDGTDTNRSALVHIMDGVKAVSAGQYHTMILKTDGALWGTGNNGYGQLGDTLGNRVSPVQIMSGVFQVSAGGGHTMIIKTDGTLWGTGENASGQLGDGTTIERHAPIQIMNNVSNVSAGMHHTMILKNDGTLYTVGENSSGELGDGSTTNKSTPVNIP